MNVAQILGEQASARPDALALIAPDGLGVTFGELDAASASAAQFLRRAGLRPGDAVLVLHPMAVELYVMLIALFRLNLTAVFIDPGAGLKQIDACCAAYPLKAFLGTARAHLLRCIVPALRRVPLKFSVGMPVPGATLWKPGNDADAPLLACSPDTSALVTFTSGSTGQPKTVVRTHGVLLAQHRALAATLGFVPGDRVLAALPMFVLSHLASGVTSVLPAADLRRPAQADPEPLVKQISDAKVTGMELPPSLLERIAEQCIGDHVTLPGVRQVYVGGAPVFPGLVERARRALPSARVVALYGSTEAEPIAEVADHEITGANISAMRSGRGILAGRPVPQVKLRILHDRWGDPLGPYREAEFAAAGAGPGEAGEIVVAGDHVLKGYWGGAGDALIKFRVGETIWHRTGDAGYLDSDGRLWLLGRCAARVTDDRGTVYPLAVEDGVSAHPAIRRCALVQQHGRRIVVVEPRRKLARCEVEQLRRQLAWAAVDDVHVMRRIPVDRRHNSKIDYPALAARLRPSLLRRRMLGRLAHAFREKNKEGRSMLLRIGIRLHLD